MKLLDLHCDTILRCVDEENGQYGLGCNPFYIDIEKLKRAEAVGQFFAVYVDLKKYPDRLERCLALVDRFYLELSENSEAIRIASNYQELEHNMAQGKLSAFLCIEEGGAIQGKLENLRAFYRLGVRLITLTWNYPNEIGYPNFEWTYADKGLTAFGEEVVREMNRLGMLIDVSHLSDQGFYDVARLSNQPFVASHSDARALVNNPRNLTNDMIRILAEKGGVTGINFECTFLGDSETGTIGDIVRHVKHIRKVGGVEVLAIGTDFDGTMNPVEMTDIGQMDRLVEELRKEGFSEGELEKIFYKNAIRVIKDVLR